MYSQVATDVVSATTEREPSVGPSGLSATATHESVSLSWTMSEQPSWVTEAEYVHMKRERRANQQSHSKTTAGSLTWQKGVTDYTFTDTSVFAGHTYYYRIGAGIGGRIHHSEWVSVTVEAPPDDPDGSREGAAAIDIAGAIDGRLFLYDQVLHRAGGDGVDHHTFTTDARYELGLGVRQQRVDLDATLEDAEGNTLATSGPPTGDDTIEWLRVDPEPGTYYIRVEAMEEGITGYYIRFGLKTLPPREPGAAPAFGSATYDFSIAEDAAVNAAVGSMSATDADNDPLTTPSRRGTATAGSPSTAAREPSPWQRRWTMRPRPPTR